MYPHPTEILRYKCTPVVLGLFGLWCVVYPLIIVWAIYG